jgi:hypothetical protein
MVTVFIQEPSGSKSRNTRANNGDFHRRKKEEEKQKQRIKVIMNRQAAVKRVNNGMSGWLCDEKRIFPRLCYPVSLTLILTYHDYIREPGGPL